jgi:hypothetical protein
MKKVFSLMAISLFLWCGLILNVSASSYVNEKGVLIDEEIVNEFKDVMNPDSFKYMDQFIYNTYVFKHTHGFDRTTQIYVNKDLIQNGKIIKSESFVVSEKEYNEKYAIESHNDCSNNNLCWQTSALKVELENSSSSPYLTSTLYVNWLTVPSVKSYDILAFRYSNFNILDAQGLQYVNYDTANPICYVWKDSSINGNAFTKASNGIGIAMGLSPKGNEPYPMQMFIWGTYKKGGSLVATYQHTNSPLTLNEAKNYSFNSAGLENVINYSSATIANKYSGSPGITYVYK